MTANHIARMSAKRLMQKFGDDLPFAVEKVIHGAAGEPGQFDDIGRSRPIERESGKPVGRT